MPTLAFGGGASILLFDWIYCSLSASIGKLPEAQANNPVLSHRSPAVLKRPIMEPYTRSRRCAGTAVVSLEFGVWLTVYSRA